MGLWLQTVLALVHSSQSVSSLVFPGCYLCWQRCQGSSILFPLVMRSGWSGGPLVPQLQDSIRIDSSLTQQISPSLQIQEVVEVFFSFNPASENVLWEKFMGEDAGWIDLIIPYTLGFRNYFIINLDSFGDYWIDPHIDRRTIVIIHMKASKQYIQLGFKKKPRCNKENHLDSINRIIDQKAPCQQLNPTETSYLLSSIKNHKVRHTDNRLPIRKRLRSVEEPSFSKSNNRSYLCSVSHRSRSKSKLEERLEEMLINQRAKQQSLSLKERGRTVNLTTTVLPTEPCKPGKFIPQGTLSKYLNQLTEEADKTSNVNTNDSHTIQQLSHIISLIDSIFGVNKSQKLVSSYREDKSLSISSLISTIKTKLEDAARQKSYLESRS